MAKHALPEWNRLSDPAMAPCSAASRIGKHDLHLQTRTLESIEEEVPHDTSQSEYRAADRHHESSEGETGVGISCSHGCKE